MWYMYVLPNDKQMGQHTMQDYMRALMQRFDTAISPEVQRLTKEIDQLLEELRTNMGRSERKILLRLIDAEDSLLDEATLQSSIAGFRLAIGIWRELSEQPPYSFIRDEEERARKHFSDREV